jgi:hypothetical protein
MERCSSPCLDIALRVLAKPKQDGLSRGAILESRKLWEFRVWTPFLSGNIGFATPNRRFGY